MAKPDTPQDMYELWSKMMFPIADSKEIEKKLGELAVVEHWLKANVNMVQLTQKTLQYQLAMLKGGEKAQDMMANMGREEDKPAEPPNPTAWAWNMMAESLKPPKPVRKRRGKT